MNDCVLKQSKLIISWEGYPRVYYFSRRFLDLRGRFKRISGALPNTLQDDDLTTSIQQLSKTFEKNHIHIIVLGAEELSTSDIHFGNPASIDVVCTKDSGCPTTILCPVSIKNFDDLGQYKTISSVQSASRSAYLQDAGNVDSLIVVCKTQNHHTVKECMEFRADMLDKIHTAIPDISYNIEIILIPILTDIKQQISLIYEARIARRLSAIHSFLDGFTKPLANNYQHVIKIRPNEAIQQNIKEYLSNTFTVSDVNTVTFLRDLTNRLAHVSKCSIVLPLSVKFSIPQWLCNHLLHEIQFEEALIQSVSTDTKHELEKLKQISKYIKRPIVVVNRTLACRKLCKHIVQNLVLGSLQNDFDMVIIKAEKTMSSMKSLTTVMGKMMFEIEGYLNQIHVDDVTCPQMFSSCNIPYLLRKEIIDIQDVYGVGTIYGQFEIHVDVGSETRFLEIIKLVEKLTTKHKFPYSFTIKNIQK